MAILLCPSLARALSAPVECSLRQIFEEYGWNSSDELLLSLERLVDALDHYMLACEPPVGEFGLDENRILSSLAPGSTAAALEEISKGESEKIEFKSSLLLDVRSFKNDPGRPIENYRMVGLVFPVLKSIAALANSDGGTVYVGVEDDGNIFGLREDFSLVNPVLSDYDRWSLYLRSQVSKNFFDGRAVNASFRTNLLEHEGRPFVQIQVASRDSLIFLKRDGQNTTYELYVRSGTSSIPIEYHEIQKHFELRRRI